MKINYFLLLITVSLVSCVPGKSNQYIKEAKIQKRNGKWVETNSTEQGDFVSKGKYRKGDKVGIWRTFIDDKIDQKEVYRKDKIKTQFFYPNGKIKIKGQSTTEVADNFIHWYYHGDWKYYNEKGKLIYIKKYDKGNKTDSIALTKIK
ncbi:toxin-antitoxin system YwqK family antitoxin [Chryseobacterium salivictor]|uniref:MORN repeat variant n=1 Tax=Chryseobacterium salivictor TaxID=2547600 RepID=A0A4P6ZIA4_9FLAO|nr:hypothetical protein [Chryseobacterium salivictor]QBO59463.1 hypothetical protein NBC122_02661 [Chryseobacterium salivictor]